MIPDLLETDRLVLRPLEVEDAPRLVEALADWEVVKWLAVVPWPYTAGDAEAYIAANAPGGALRGAGERTWALALRAHPRHLIGVLGLGEELGYWLDADAWRQGLAAEACRAVLSAHFARPEAAGEVLAGWFEGNERSERLLRKLGFVEVETGTRPCLARGEDLGSHVMRLTKAASAA